MSRRSALLAGLAVLVATLPALPAAARDVTGSAGADVLRGTPAADLIKGRGGSDRLFGRAGGDRVSGGKGNDRLFGGIGRDRLAGGRGADRVSGGPGADVLDCGGGNDRAAADPADTVRANCETVTGLPDPPPPPPPPPPSPPPPSAADLLQGEYTGDLVTTITYIANSGCSGQQTARIPSRITIRAPLQPLPTDLETTGGDPNPINLVLGQTNVGAPSPPARSTCRRPLASGSRRSTARSCPTGPSP